MQLQMEVWNLEECDCFETVFQEYETTDEHAFEKIYSQLMLEGGKKILEELKNER